MALAWLKTLQYDPLPALLKSGDPALVFFARRDLLDEDPGPWDRSRQGPDFLKILQTQQPDGSWAYPTRKKAYPSENFHLLETYRKLGILIEKFGLDRTHAAISQAAEYTLAHQTPEGDIRGIFGSQYAPHYSAGILELLVKAGYGEDQRISDIFQWLAGNLQSDGGWAWPLRTARVPYPEALKLDRPVRTNPSKPFSHALTSFVLRAYAAHPALRGSDLARKAGTLLKGRFFLPDLYPDRKGIAYWFKFQFPFWWGNLLTSLDSLSLLGFSAGDPQIRRGLQWFLENQLPTGLWPTGYGKGARADANQAWVGLAICRMWRRFGEG